MADLDKAAGQHVEEESAHEFLASDGRGFSESGLEADVSVADLEQAMVGDAHTMGVVAEIGVDLGWTGEGTLGVDDPFLAVERVVGGAARAR
jgi:hypothetical protein